MGFDELSNTRLVLGLGISSSLSADNDEAKKVQNVLKINSEPYLSLNLFGDAVKKSADSSLSNESVKREREMIRTCCEEEEEENVILSERKKLRLTKIQSAHLEDSFKRHTTLTPRQKQDLARELKLRPRQVEVWFQNRRARTKLKQTETECEFLKKCYDSLTDENRRLLKEVKELKAVKSARPFYMHLPAATLTMCPSCEKIAGGGGGVAAAKSPFNNNMPPIPKQLFCKPFTNPSAAC